MAITLAEKLAIDFQIGDEKAMARESQSDPPSGNHRMHEWGHPCKLYLWFMRNKWDELKPRTSYLGKIFWKGKKMEEPAAFRLRDSAGKDEWNVERVKQPLILPREGRSPVVGHIDYLAHHIPTDGLIIAEIKTVEEHMSAKLQTWEDFLKSPHWFHRAQVKQLMSYSLAAYEAEITTELPGVIVKCSPGSGDMSVVPIPVIDELIDECHANADFAERKEVDYNESRIPYEPQICGVCSFKDVCLPALKGDDGTIVVEENIQELLSEWKELNDRIVSEDVKRKKKIEDNLKDVARALGDGKHITKDGLFAFGVTPGGRHSYWDAPPEIEKKYKKAKQKASSVKIYDLESAQEA